MAGIGNFAHGRLDALRATARKDCKRGILKLVGLLEFIFNKEGSSFRK